MFFYFSNLCWCHAEKESAEDCSLDHMFFKDTVELEKVHKSIYLCGHDYSISRTEYF